MEGSITSRLCGGTFFALLLQARKPRRKARESLAGGTDGLKDTDVLIGLIRVAQSDYPAPPITTFSQNTSAYKACTMSHGTYLPFDDDAFVAGFNARVETQYGKATAAMGDFINSYLDIDSAVKMERLVKGLLELVDEDQGIPDDKKFYINEDGTPLAKSAMRDVETVCLQPLLLGVWHYIVTNVPDNTVGQATFEAWHEKPEQKGQQRKFISTIGSGIARNIRIATGTVFDIEENTEAEVGEPQPEYDEVYEEPTPVGTTTQTVSNPTIFQQYGNNNVQIESVQTLTIKND